MKVLCVNKFFRFGAGAETVFFNTRALLTAAGHEIVDFSTESHRNETSPYASYFAPERDYSRSVSVTARARNAAASVYSRESRLALRQLVRDTAPDVAHLHNVYHQLTLSVVDELRSLGVPTVMTLHDYKMMCPAYLMYRTGRPCRKCVHGTAWNAVLHSCIKKSAAASVLAALETSLARVRGSYAQVARFIAPSRFIAQLASKFVDSDHIVYLPNFLPNATRIQDVRPAGARRRIVAFVGRLDDAKGIVELVELFRSGRVEDVKLVVAGAGPLRSYVARAAADTTAIDYLGSLARPEVSTLLGEAALCAVPSLSEENCPMSILEARAAGAPVVAAPVGGIPELVAHGVDGWLADPRDTVACSSAILRLIGDEALRDRMAHLGLERLRAHHSPEVHLPVLIDTYRAAALDVKVADRTSRSCRRLEAEP